MCIRKVFLLSILALFLAGCVVQVRPAVRHSPHNEEEYHDTRSNPSYMGFYYARIVFIQGMPYYVDDERHIRQIPLKFHSHFVSYPYDRISKPLAFSQDNEVRDGYRMSRIIYFDGTPFQVNDDRSAYPLPKRLHPRFVFSPSAQGKQTADDRTPLQNRRDRALKKPRATGPHQEPMAHPFFGREQPDRKQKTTTDQPSRLVDPEKKRGELTQQQLLHKKQQDAGLVAGKEQGSNGKLAAENNIDKRQDDKKKQLDRIKDKQRDRDDADETKDNGNISEEMDETDGDTKKKLRKNAGRDVDRNND